MPSDVQLLPQITYEQFCEAWIDDVRAHSVDEELSTPEFRREVVRKMLNDWLDSDLSDAEFIWTGAGRDSGIDAFYLDETFVDEGESTFTARVVRFVLPSDIPAQGRAVLRDIAKIRATLNDETRNDELEPLREWWREGKAGHHLNVLFVSVNALPPSENEAIAGAEAMLCSEARGSVSAEALSLQTIYRRDHIDTTVRAALRIQVPPVAPGAQFVLGAVALPDLYEFLKSYREARGDLDPLYEKNVRLFLGRAGKINRGISRTLREEPENFGLYNNGLTIVTREIVPDGGTIVLTDPSVVNGCQTTRTLWETVSELMRAPLETDSTKTAAWRNWREKFGRGQIVVKVVRVAPAEDEGLSQDDALLGKITRYTNSQNAVRERDFVSLDRDFRRWKRELALKGVFLEILRNEGTAQKARQTKRGYNGPQYAEIAKAFELLKVYGAGWMSEPGDAWNNNNAFLPKGRIFKEIVREENPFGGDDFLAALHLQNAADKQKFGRPPRTLPEEKARALKLTRYLFFRTSLELLRRVLTDLDLPCDNSSCTRALLELKNSENEWRKFVDYATETIAEYMKPSGDYTIYREPTYEGDFNAFFKKTGLAKTQTLYPQLWLVWNMTVRDMRRDAPFWNRVEPLLQHVLAP